MCMALPSDLMESLRLNSVSNYRASTDYAFTGDPLTLAYVFETLYTRFERREAHQPAPDPSGWRAHFVVQSHLDYLGLTRRRYVTYVEVRQRLLREGFC